MTDGTPSVTVLSYNVRYEGADEGEHAWEHRRDAVTQLIADCAPDIICLQEVWLGQLDDIRERLPAFDWLGTSVFGGEHTPIGYDPDRFTVADWGAFSLSETPEDPTVPGWDATYPRVTTWARLTDDNGEELTVFNTHFDHEGERAREESAALLVERVTATTTPVVVAGDLNCEPGSTPHARLVAPTSPLRDTREGGGAAAAQPTFNDFGGQTGGKRLDHVLVTDGISVEQFTVRTDEVGDGQFPSDHYPVVVACRFGAV